MRGLLAIACLATFVSGCKTFGVAARIDPPKVASYGWARCVLDNDNVPHRRAKDNKERPINLDCFKFPEQTRKSISQITETVVRTPTKKAGDRTIDTTVSTKVISKGGDFTAYDSAVLDPAMRNRLAAVLLKQADDQCVRNSGIIVGNEAAVNTILDLLTTGLTSAATIVTGKKADSILTGIGAFTSGARGQINSDVYRGQITQAITTAITSEQKRLRQAIDVKRSGGLAAYNVDEMIRDVNEYYQACSFYKGLELVLKSADEYPKLAAAQKRAVDTRDLQYFETRLTAVRLLIPRLNAAATPDPDRIKLATDEEAQLAEYVKQRRTALYGGVQPDAAPTDGSPEITPDPPTPPEPAPIPGADSTGSAKSEADPVGPATDGDGPG